MLFVMFPNLLFIINTRRIKMYFIWVHYTLSYLSHFINSTKCIKPSSQPREINTKCDLKYSLVIYFNDCFTLFASQLQTSVYLVIANYAFVLNKILFRSIEMKLEFLFVFLYFAYFAKQIIEFAKICLYL